MDGKRQDPAHVRRVKRLVIDVHDGRSFNEGDQPRAWLF